MIRHPFSSGMFYNADCFDVLPKLRAESVDMILADLPYGTTANKWDSVLPLEDLWSAFQRVTKPSAAIVLTASQPFTSTLIQSARPLFRHEWVWQKNRGSNFLNLKREPVKEHESVLMFSRGAWTFNKQMQERKWLKPGVQSIVRNSKATTRNYRKFNSITGREYSRLRSPSSCQAFDVVTRGIHPTQKPVELFEYLIRTYTRPGDLVLDNTAGVGTTAVAACRLSRRWICIEKDSDYYAKAIARVDLEDFG